MSFAFDINNYLKNMSEDELQRKIQQLDDDTLRRLQEGMDDEMAQQLIFEGILQQVGPLLREVRQRRQTQDSTEHVREVYAELTEEQQQEVFYEQMTDIVDAIYTLREDGTQAATPKIKPLLRDPWTIEALLLIFRNENHIDPDYSEEMMDLGAEMLTWVGVALAPGMYEPETVEYVAEKIDRDVQYVE